MGGKNSKQIWIKKSSPNNERIATTLEELDEIRQGYKEEQHRKEVESKEHLASLLRLEKKLYHAEMFSPIEEEEKEEEEEEEEEEGKVKNQEGTDDSQDSDSQEGSDEILSQTDSGKDWISPDLVEIPLSERIATIEELVEEKTHAKGRLLLSNPEVQKMVKIAKDFIRENDMILYGGTALNELMPADLKFYNREHDFPDLDAFCEDAREKAVALAQILYKNGIQYVEARSAAHEGVYKVFADTLPLCDFHDMDRKTLESIDSFVGTDGLKFCGPKWLRIDLYRELAEPEGEFPRWPKVYKRLQLLNQTYPLENSCVGVRKNDDNSIQPEKGTTLDIVQKMTHIVLDYVKTSQIPLCGVSTFGLYRYENECSSDDQAILDSLQFTLDRYMNKEDANLSVASDSPEKTAKDLKRILSIYAIPFSFEITESQEYLEPLGDDLLSLSAVDQNTGESFRIVNIYPLTKKCLAVRPCGGFMVASISTTIFILLVEYFINPSSQRSKTRMCLVEQLIETLNNHQDQLKKGHFSYFSEVCYGKAESLTDKRRRKIDENFVRRLEGLSGKKSLRTSLSFNPDQEETIQAILGEGRERSVHFNI